MSDFDDDARVLRSSVAEAVIRRMDRIGSSGDIRRESYLAGAGISDVSSEGRAWIIVGGGAGNVSELGQDIIANVGKEFLVNISSRHP
jgi:hypothetical protein